MIVGERVQERLDASGLTQAELARRIGVAQPTIHNLIHRAKKGSTHLHRVARELGTTPAYLTGETDDPTAELPDFDPMTSDETRLLAKFRALDRDGRAAVIQVVRLMAAGVSASERVTNASAQEQLTIPPEAALAEMFQGLLRAPQTKGMSGDALARGLARLLPSGLRQVQGPLRIEQTDTGDGQAARLEDHQHNRPGQRQASRK